MRRWTTLEIYHAFNGLLLSGADSFCQAADHDRLVAKAQALRDLLTRIRQWDMLDVCTDGPFWKREIDAALAQATPKEAK